MGSQRDDCTVVAWKWTLHVRYTRSLFVVMNMNLVKKLRLRFVQNCVVSEDEKEKNAWTIFTLHGYELCVERDLVSFPPVYKYVAGGSKKYYKQ